MRHQKLTAQAMAFILVGGLLIPSAHALRALQADQNLELTTSLQSGLEEVEQIDEMLDRVGAALVDEIGWDRFGVGEVFRSESGARIVGAVREGRPYAELPTLVLRFQVPQAEDASRLNWSGGFDTFPVAMLLNQRVLDSGPEYETSIVEIDHPVWWRVFGVRVLDTTGSGLVRIAGVMPGQGFFSGPPSEFAVHPLSGRPDPSELWGQRRHKLPLEVTPVPLLWEEEGDHQFALMAQIRFWNARQGAFTPEVRFDLEVTGRLLRDDASVLQAKVILQRSFQDLVATQLAFTRELGLPLASDLNLQFIPAVPAGDGVELGGDRAALNQFMTDQSGIIRDMLLKLDLAWTELFLEEGLQVQVQRYNASRPNSENRLEAVEALGGMGIPLAAIPVLVGALGERSQVSLAAENVLASIGPDRPDLNWILADELGGREGDQFRSRRVRVVARTLARIGEAAIPDLRAALGDPRRRAGAAWTLAAMEPRLAAQAVPELVRAIDDVLDIDGPVNRRRQQNLSAVTEALLVIGEDAFGSEGRRAVERLYTDTRNLGIARRAGNGRITALRGEDAVVPQSRIQAWQRLTSTGGLEELQALLEDSTTQENLQTQGFSQVPGGFLARPAAIEATPTRLILQTGLEEPQGLPNSVPLLWADATTVTAMLDFVEQAGITSTDSFLFNGQYFTRTQAMAVLPATHPMPASAILPANLNPTAQEVAVILHISRQTGTVFVANITRFTATDGQAYLFIQIQA